MALLAACDTPGSAFRDSPATRIRTGGSVFDIRVRDGRAEAIRLDGRWAPRLAAVGVPAVFAIETVSGCRVDRLRGDQARMVAALDCGNCPPPAVPRGDLYCDVDLHDEDTGSAYCVPAGEAWPQGG